MAETNKWCQAIVMKRAARLIRAITTYHNNRYAINPETGNEYTQADILDLAMSLVTIDTYSPQENLDALNNLIVSLEKVANEIELAEKHQSWLEKVVQKRIEKDIETITSTAITSKDWTYSGEQTLLTKGKDGSWKIWNRPAKDENQK